MLNSRKLLLLLMSIMVKILLCRGQLISSISSSSPSSLFSFSMRSLSPYTGQTFASNLSEFASRIYQKTAAQNSGNLIMSPLSADTVLALLSLGAKASTCTELKNGLLLETNAKSIGNDFQTILQPMQNNSQISIANGIFVQQGYKLRPQFSTMAQKQFYSNVSNINFDDPILAANILNNWASKETHGKISSLFKSQSIDGVKMVLVNAIYFKGKWSVPFVKRTTYKQKFQLGNCNSTNTKVIKMMHNTHFYNYGNISSLSAEVVELPYKDSSSSMLIFLPWACDGLADLENALTKFDLSTLNKRMNGGAYKVVLTLPRFSIQSTIDLKPILQSMGMGKIFNANEANFEDMLLPKSSSSSSEVGLYVSKVIQKAMLDVDESGTEAEAVTYVGNPGAPGLPGLPPLPQKIIYFQASRPFMYMIRNKESPLFMGRFVS